MIKKILIANRGEIARRIIRTARNMGISTVSIYSEADKNAQHRFDADENYFIGPAPSSQSYLNQKAIIDLAIECRCDAIHPGYGFLSENADFADRVAAAGLNFIGPRAETIRLMGDKLAAKNLAKAHGVPLLPGTEEPVGDLVLAKDLAGKIGYPVLLKAAGGGGGKGMRIVHGEDDFDALFRLASSEANQSFGDARVFIEKYLAAPKHIEVQIMADHFGNAVHLFERDCSVQRRHQKVLEESPAPSIGQSLRDKITEAALLLCKACDYVGAGTVEFLVDHKDNFYFLEMNTRLQVEHPVTEMITGLDLVAWQIAIANGQHLSAQQTDIKVFGHSIELRIYAEDIFDEFRPSLGSVCYYREPAGTGVRIDGAISQDYVVPIYYDPMLAKLIVWGKDRTEAIHRLKWAIEEFNILGVATTLPLGLFILDHSDFQSGIYTTDFLAKYFEPGAYRESLTHKAKIAARVLARLRLNEIRKPVENGHSKNWKYRQ